jgi:hypothetical protein
MHNKSLYHSFLMLEFAALAVLIGSLFWLGHLTQDGQSLNQAHRLLPTVASGLVLTGFLGCMYVRWIDASKTGADSPRVPQFLFWCLVLTLFLIWLLAAAQWMLSDLDIPPTR